MWQFAQDLLASRSPWSSIFFLLVGAVLGALVSGFFTVRAQRPQLSITGSGGGSTNSRSSCSISISDYPTLGVRFAGEVAREVRAYLQPKRQPQNLYPLAWAGQEPGLPATLEPGQTHQLEVVSCFVERRGSYFIVDHTGEPIAKFDLPDLDFVLRLVDRLGRVQKIKIRVKFDDSHLKNSPQLQVLHPLSPEIRFRLFRSGVQQALRAFRPRL